MSFIYFLFYLILLYYVFFSFNIFIILLSAADGTFSDSLLTCLGTCLTYFVSTSVMVVLWLQSVVIPTVLNNLVYFPEIPYVFIINDHRCQSLIVGVTHSRAHSSKNMTGVVKICYPNFVTSFYYHSSKRTKQPKLRYLPFFTTAVLRKVSLGLQFFLLPR